jgi:hypothetical protein
MSEKRKWLERVRTRRGELDDADRALSEAEVAAQEAGATEQEVTKAYEAGKR